MVWLFKAKSYGFPKVEGDRGLWKPGGKLGLWFAQGMAEAEMWIE